jgi:RNA polymerase sigma-70 factor (ECF subfamily)
MKYLLLNYMNETAGTQARRRGLAEEGIWLGRLVASLLLSEPEALGLLALMLHAEARRDQQGEFVPLDVQDPARWDGTLIDEAEALLLSASRMNAPDRFQLEAAVQSAHAARRFAGTTDWAAIVKLYDALLALTGSVVVAINRAVALAAHLNGPRGAAEGLAALDALKDDAQVAQYQPYWAARAALLARTGSAQAAAEAYRRAIGLESDPAVRRFLQAELLRVEEALVRKAR